MFHYQAPERIVDSFAWGNQGSALYTDWFGRLVVILRGMPGSGKTTFAAEMQFWATIRGLRTVIVSADHYFYSRRGYQFDKSKLREAHASCQSAFAAALADIRVDIVIVDNTSITRDECLAYYYPADRPGIRVQVVEFECVDLEVAMDLRIRGEVRPPVQVIEDRFALYASNRDIFANLNVHRIIVDPYEDRPENAL